MCAFYKMVIYVDYFLKSPTIIATKQTDLNNALHIINGTQATLARISFFRFVPVYPHVLLQLPFLQIPKPKSSKNSTVWRHSLNVN